MPEWYSTHLSSFMPCLHSSYAAWAHAHDDHYLMCSKFNSLLTEMITPQTRIYIYYTYKPLPVLHIIGARSGSPRIKVSIMALFFIQTASALEDQVRILAPLKVRVCFKPFQTLRNLLSKQKDPIPDLQKSSVVYKIPCGHCSASYIGQTSRRLCQWL